MEIVTPEARKRAAGAESAIRPLRRDVTASYDLGVEGYEQEWSPVILPGAEALLPWLGLDEGSVVVDVGAGTGALARAIRATAPAACVIGLDASAAMLRLARQRGVPSARADAVVLPVADETVNAVVPAYVLFHLNDPQAAVREAARVLRPGGRVGTVTWASERTERAQVIWSDTLAEAGVPVLAARRIDTALDSPAAIDALLQRAGFVPDRIWTKGLHRQWDPESFWALATGSGVNRQRLAQIDPDARDALLARLRHRLNELTPQDYWWEGEVICAVATKPRTSRDG